MTVEERLAAELNATRANLRWLDRHYPDIEAHLMPSQGGGERSNNKPDSRPPLNTRALSLTQRAGIAGALSEWLKIVVVGRDINPPEHRLADGPFVHATIRILATHVDWLADNLGGEDWRELRHQIGGLRRETETVLGLVNEAPIPGDNKLCVLDMIDIGLCGGKLFQDYDLDVIYCKRCHSVWDKSRWLHLGLILREAAAEVPA